MALCHVYFCRLNATEAFFPPLPMIIVNSPAWCAWTIPRNTYGKDADTRFNIRAPPIPEAPARRRSTQIGEGREENGEGGGGGDAGRAQHTSSILTRVR